jgi:gliding motility-associated-like protein
MKNIILIILVLLTFSAKSQTVYFNQDFNSSPLLSTYFGGTITANKFTTIATNNNANATVNIVDNKIRIVKTNASGTNRASLIRTTTLAGVPANGAGLLKYSVEVTISGNEGDIPSGFMFTVGQITSTAPAAPGNAEIHSSFYVNPTKNPGEFKIGTTLGTSEAFVGTKTIIWYINNSGIPVGYMAPDGALSTVENDAADIWVVDANSQTLVIDEEPAVTPTVLLRGFKISNNPNFTATIDIDDLKLSEEPTLPAKAIVSVEAVEPVEVPIKTAFNRLPFPTEVEVTYDDNTKETIGIRFSEVDKYNMYIAGTYSVLGTLVPKRGGINPNQVKVNTTVTTRNTINLTNTFSPNGDGVNDTWVIPELKSYRQVNVEIFDRDGKTLFKNSDPSIGWDGKNRNGEIISGSYFYIITVRDLSLTKRGVLTVIK